MSSDTINKPVCVQYVIELWAFSGCLLRCYLQTQRQPQRLYIINSLAPCSGKTKRHLSYQLLNQNNAKTAAKVHYSFLSFFFFFLKLHCTNQENGFPWLPVTSREDCQVCHTHGLTCHNEWNTHFPALRFSVSLTCTENIQVNKAWQVKLVSIRTWGHHQSLLSMPGQRGQNTLFLERKDTDSPTKNLLTNVSTNQFHYFIYLLYYLFGKVSLY